MKTITKTIHPAFALFALACFALSPRARAVCQQGCDTSNNNTFLGDDALISNTTGVYNTAVGSAALLLNTTGYQNTATGASALTSNDGFANTANGYSALQQNTSGFHNTANGAAVLQFNTTGSNNTANGATALLSNTSGFDNTADGAGALFSNTTGINNAAVGLGALDYNTTGSRNIAIGYAAGSNLTTGSYNIYVGTPGGDARESNKIRIGTSGLQTKTFISGISGVTVPAGVGVIVGTNGQLGTVVSSERFKDAIKPMEKASEAILALQPVTFRYKHEIDPNGTPQFGLVAEEVEKVNPDLVARDEQGKPYTVRYEAVNAMLLNEFLKEHREVQEQKATIAEFKKEIANLTATVKQQSAQIQKVSARLELSKTAPQTVRNDQ
jgi:Chaperone of endosialidase